MSSFIHTVSGFFLSQFYLRIKLADRQQNPKVRNERKKLIVTKQANLWARALDVDVDATLRNNKTDMINTNFRIHSICRQ